MGIVDECHLGIAPICHGDFVSAIPFPGPFPVLLYSEVDVQNFRVKGKSTKTQHGKTRSILYDISMPRSRRLRIVLPTSFPLILSIDAPLIPVF